MTMLIGVLLAAAFGLWIYNDAKLWEAKGTRVGSLGPAGWFWLSFLMLIVGGPLYVYNRRKLTRPGGSRRISPPGWHQDPDDPSLLRWWDGSRWTEHTSVVDLPPPPDQ